jgi:MEMO1 family protein
MYIKSEVLILGKVKAMFVMPHPPIIIPSVGGGRERDAAKTVQAMKDASDTIYGIGPDTIVIMTPHGRCFSDYFNVSSSPTLSGDLGEFGSNESLSFINDVALAKAIGRSCQADGIDGGILSGISKTQFNIDDRLDHGAIVPLYFVKKKYDEEGKALPKLVHIAISGLTLISHYRFGMAISKAVSGLDSNVCIIASGDLSHAMSEESPYGFNPSGPILDKAIVGAMSSFDPMALFKIDPSVRKNGAECGLRSIIAGFGALDGVSYEGRVISYEGPFGIGYGVAEFISNGIPKESALSEIENAVSSFRAESSSNMGALASIAKASLEHYVTSGKYVSREKALSAADSAKNKSDQEIKLLDESRGAFVSLKIDGELRGCIGTIMPMQDDLLDEIIENAVSAGVRDPRFPSVSEDELEDIIYSVDVLFTPEPITSRDELDPKTYGVIVRKDHRSGLLLPDLEGVDAVEKQISIALSKAGISESEDYSMERFKVVRFK